MARCIERRNVFSRVQQLETQTLALSYAIVDFVSSLIDSTSSFVRRLALWARVH